LVVEEMLSRVEPELKDDLGVDMVEEDIVWREEDDRVGERGYSSGGFDG
jgi:hypothetical protein